MSDFIPIKTATIEPKKEFVITFEECRQAIKKRGNVCPSCGGEIQPIETVDNGNRPTHWAGCLPCQTYTRGVKHSIFVIASDLVRNYDWIAYRHIKKGEYQNNLNYYFEQQIKGVCKMLLEVESAKATLEKELKIQALKRSIVIRRWKGYPTKKSLDELIYGYVELGYTFESLAPAQNYSNSRELLYSSNSDGDHITNFVLYARELGVEFEEFGEYNPPRVGFLKLKRQYQDERKL